MRLMLSLTSVSILYLSEDILKNKTIVRLFLKQFIFFCKFRNLIYIHHCESTRRCLPVNIRIRKSTAMLGFITYMYVGL